MKDKLNFILKNKNSKLLIVITIFIMFGIVLGLSYAYFVPNTGSNSASTPGNVTGGTSDRLVFREGDALNLSFGSHNLNENTGNITESTNPTATLYASNEEVGTVGYYNVGFYVGSNTFVYSTGALETPELILTIRDPEGNLITEVDGLTYYSENGLSGFDITEVNVEYFVISANYKIESNLSSGKVDTWSFELTLVNLSTSQNINRDSDVNFMVMMHDESDQDINFAYQILEHNGGKDIIESKGTPNYNYVPTINEGMFSAPDIYGTSYYFRGAVDNNWVYFAGFYWRIVRINGDGSVRLLYSGNVAPDETQKVVMTGTETEIGKSSFNTAYELAENTGYMYTVGEQHGITLSSSSKMIIDRWYEINILTTEYNSKIADNYFCVDRTSYIREGSYSNYTYTLGGTGVGSSSSNPNYFGTYIRNFVNITPSYECTEKNDVFTVNDEVNGNSALTYPIGLLTADEATMAGLLHNVNNANNFLYTNQSYWTLSPSDHWYTSGSNFSLLVNSSGKMNPGYIGGKPGTNGEAWSINGIRPVLSIDSSFLTTGTGTWNDPYIII